MPWKNAATKSYQRNRTPRRIPLKLLRTATSALPTGARVVRWPRVFEHPKSEHPKSVIDHQPKLLDHGLPFAFLAVNVLRVFRRRTDQRIATGIQQPLLHVIGVYDLSQLAVQPVDDGLWCPSRRNQS